MNAATQLLIAALLFYIQPYLLFPGTTLLYYDDYGDRCSLVFQKVEGPYNYLEAYCTGHDGPVATMWINYGVVNGESVYNPRVAWLQLGMVQASSPTKILRHAIYLPTILEAQR